MTVHTGTCGALAEVACDDHDDPLGSYLHTDVTAGAEYRIDVTRAPGADPTAIAIDVSFDPDSPICPHDAGDFAFKKTTITFASPPGRESRVTLKARAELRAPVPDVATNGLQLLVEDAGTHAYTPVVEWSARTLAVPPGGPGTGCAPKDGWTTGANGASARYRNESNAFPPDCAPGSANGLVDVRVKRRADDPRVADVKVQARGTTFSAPIATLEDARLSLTFDATLGAGMVERCAVTFFALRCKVGGGSKVVCR